MRGFVQGVMWGGLAAVGGLVVLSQVAGPVAPRPDSIALTPQPTETAAPEPAQPSLPEPALPEPEPPEREQPEREPASVAPPSVAQPSTAPATESDAPVAPAPPDSLAPATTALPAAPPPVAPPSAPPPLAPPVPDGAATVSQAPAQPPAPPASESPADALASAGRIDPVIPPVVRAPPMAATLPASPRLPTAEPAPRNPEPPPPPPAMPDPTPEPAPMPAADQSDTAPPEAAVPEPAPNLAGPVSGVVTGRLPRIGVEEAAGPPGLAVAPQADLPPRLRFARPFDNAAQKPLFAILLIDTGSAEVNRDELMALDLPLSIVIDPLADGAADRAALWRAGGHEVLMAASGIPVGASPADLEQSLQVLSSGLPEAVALVDSDGTGFQNNSPLASQMVSILADQGRGLVTLDQGLNAAAQEARRAALPAATIFRRLDAADEAAPVILRYLDRAAFQAAQNGQVAVIGILRPQTVAGIVEWAAGGRASSVALAPITALLHP